jgi:hypothetical protein
MKHTLLLVAALSLCGIAVAGSKSYEVNFTTAAKAGSVELAPGQYKLTVDGSNAVFTDSHRKQFTAPVKVETTTKKFAYTAVDSSPDGKSERIDAIELGGSATKLEFPK